MRYILIFTALWSQAVFAESKILINKSDQQYVVIPDCQVQEGATDILVRRLKVGAAVHVRYGRKRERCAIIEVYELTNEVSYANGKG